jgi:hypothetical protein
VPDAAIKKDKFEPVKMLDQMLRSATFYLLPKFVVVPHDKVKIAGVRRPALALPL